MVECGESKAQRDVILLSGFTVLGSMLSKLLRVHYSHKFWYPNLQFFTIAPPASGKGAISWVRKLAEPLHGDMLRNYNEKMRSYAKEKKAYEVAGRDRKDMDEPIHPPLKMFLISGNNSSTGILENLMDAEGWGLICETEADTVSNAISTDYGGWSDTLRKSYDHDRISYNRRANHEYREISVTRLSVLLSGTPAQVKPLIPSAENGLYSRQLFYSMPPIEEWINQFGAQRMDYDSIFAGWGREWKKELEELGKRASAIELRLTPMQQEAFNTCFAQLFIHAGCTREDRQMQSSVARLAINILRIMSVTALLRTMEEGSLSPDREIPEENLKDGIGTRFTVPVTEEDFTAVLALAEPLYRHATYVLALLPTEQVVARKLSPMEKVYTMLPMTFTRQEALDASAEAGVSVKTLDSNLSRMVTKGLLERVGNGVYTFTSTKK